MIGAVQTQKDPAATAIAPGLGSINPAKEKDMNRTDNSTRPASPPAPFHHPADEVGRARAITLTVWLAMNSHSFDADDIGALGDTLYEAIQRLSHAQKLMGGNHG